MSLDNQEKNTVLLIEPRFIECTLNVILQTHACLGNDWNYVFYCGSSSYEYWKKNAPHYIELRPILYIDNLLPNEYSDIMKFRNIWNSLYGKYVLTIQLDTWIVANENVSINDFITLDKSYIGGNMNYNWKELIRYDINPKVRNFNGGLSLRKREDMIRIIDTFPPKKTTKGTPNTNVISDFTRYAEDVYFTIGCYKLNLPVGDDETCSHFALHTIYKYPFFGIHNAGSELSIVLNEQFPDLIETNPYILCLPTKTKK